MKTCKACGKMISIYQRAYCSCDCAMSGGKQRRAARSARPPRPGGRNRALADARTEVEAAEEALRVLRLEMEATKTPVRPRAASLAAAEALAGELGDHGAERAMLRECSLSDIVRAGLRRLDPEL